MAVDGVKLTQTNQYTDLHYFLPPTVLALASHCSRKTLSYIIRLFIEFSLKKDI